MPESANDKATVRSRFVNDRLTLGNYALTKASSALAQRLLQTPELDVSEPDHYLTVCAYASFGTEPDTTQLIEALAERGVRVLLPVLLPDSDLDWAVYDARFEAGRFGLREPVGERLGAEAILGADVVLVPALAVSDTGQRLGRGGGSYDRALARLMVRQQGGLRRRSQPWVCALVYDHELGATFPVEPHDQPVDAACAPSRLVRFAQPSDR
ncbi:MAG TPA: 5-formyltetrahydrofolate cyclo-ligase [Actinocrinis sp.]|nr:5-formyltetrahydrofolate cyclo-ligase [Actinocrinis sp.]